MEKIDKQKVLEVISSIEMDLSNRCYDAVVKQINALPTYTDEWVSVETEYPPIGEIVLVYKPTGEHDLMFVDGLGATWFTHWRELPQPPIK